MTKYSFSSAERYAVFKTHGDRCYMCHHPIDMASFQVDHVIPETLLQQPSRLEQALRTLGRPADFDVNSFANWLPACATCNNNKRALVWEPSLLVQVSLQKAVAKADFARQEAEAVVSKRKVGHALTVLQRAYETNALTEEIKALLQPLVQDYAELHAPDADHDSVRLTPQYAAPLLQLLADDGATEVVKGPYGVGGGPSSSERDIPSGMRCGVCGYQYFNGARCVACGTMDDGD